MGRAGLQLLHKLKLLPPHDCSLRSQLLGDRENLTEDTRCGLPCLRDLGDQQHLSTLNGRAYFKVLGCPIGVNLWRNLSSDTEIKTPLSLIQSLISSKIQCQGGRGNMVGPSVVVLKLCSWDQQIFVSLGGLLEMHILRPPS